MNDVAPEYLSREAAIQVIVFHRELHGRNHRITAHGTTIDRARGRWRQIVTCLDCSETLCYAEGAL